MKKLVNDPKRYVDEAKRLYGVLDKQLAGNAYAAGAGRFIDGIEFDPHKPNDYLARFAIGLQGVSK